MNLFTQSAPFLSYSEVTALLASICSWPWSIHPRSAWSQIRQSA